MNTATVTFDSALETLAEYRKGARGPWHVTAKTDKGRPVGGVHGRCASETEANAVSGALSKLYPGVVFSVTHSPDAH